MVNVNQTRGFKSICGLTVLLLFTGCSSMGRSIGLGGAIGAGSGAILGGIIDPGKNGQYRTRNVIIGATAGGLLGSVTAAGLHENTQREKELSYLKGRESGRKKNRSETLPELEEPKVETQWIESTVKGNRYIEGHYEYIIREPSRWGAAQ